MSSQRAWGAPPPDLRVVVTAMALASPIGDSADAFWSRLLAGGSGVGPIRRFDAAGLGGGLAALVGPVPEAGPLPAPAKYLSDNTKILCHTSRALLRQAGLEGDAARPVGMVIGSAFGNYEKAMLWHQKYNRDGFAGVLPTDGIDAEHNSAMNYAAIALGATGRHVLVAAGVASGVQAIGQAYHSIRQGSADVLIAGGHERLLREVYALLAVHGAIPRGAEDAEARPFDRRRRGFVPGEGCGLLLLESEGHAIRRGATILAEVSGFGAALVPEEGEADPADRAEVAAAAARAALADAALGPGAVDCVQASASGSVPGDILEAEALARVFPREGPPRPVTSIKAATGESFGASGALSCVAAVLSIQRGRIAPTLHCRDSILPEGLRVVGPGPEERDVGAVLVHSLDASGFAASLVLRRYEPGAAARHGGDHV
ncbi:MAG: hypothetical protein IT372_22600 [Polyangiaceae bacterium]|nr:hypothetical protein [Polyangiaceae bacterium]